MFKKRLGSLSRKGDKSPIDAPPETSPKMPSMPSISLPRSRGASGISAGLDTIPFSIEELQTYGIAGKVKTLAFDPMQSLMAIVTDLNHVHIFGQSRVGFALTLTTTSAIRGLRFVKGVYLVAIDSFNTIFVISLASKKLLHKIVANNQITAFETDYSLEFIYVGLNNGTVKAYNVETGLETILSLREQQYHTFILESSVQVTSIKLSPRDIGTLLISYPKMTIEFNLAENRAVKEFIYKLPRGAPGGENATYKYDATGYYIPNVVQSLWHPNGLHVVTIHDDNSLVFWDALTGEQILARSPFDSYVDTPSGESHSGQKMTKIRKAAWLCESDPEKTSLLFCGGDSYETEGYHQIVRMDFGRMLSYSMTSYTQMAKYYAQPKQQNIFAIHAAASIVDFVPLGEESPYYDGNHGPKLIALTLSDGSLKFMNYPTGNLSFRANLFPSTISWLNPKITYSSSSFIDKKVLNGIIDTQTKQQSVLKGGIPGRPKYKADVGSVIISGHENGYIRIWSSSEGELDSSKAFEIDISRILLDDSPQFSISRVSFAPEQLEISCSMYNDDVLLFSYQQNKNFQPTEGDLNRRMSSLELSSTKAEKQIIDISDRAPRDLKKGFLPKVLIKSMGYGKVTALCNSNIGFVGIGYESGQLIVVDRRINAVIFNHQLVDDGLSLAIYPTSIEFAYGQPGLVMLVGTRIGRLLTFEITNSGRFSLRLIDQLDSNDGEITEIIPINSDTGRPATASIRHVNSPVSADRVPLSIITASSSDVRIVKNGSKMAHKTFGKGELSKVGITGTKTQKGNVAFCLVAILGASKKFVVYSIPSLSELTNMRIPYRVDPKLVSQSSVLPLGDVFLRINATEAALVNIMGLRQPVLSLETINGDDILFLQNVLIPYRPTTNYFVKGTSSLTYSRLYSLLVGRDRPASSTKPEYELAWNISPYNPSNHTLMGVSKPKYYDPNALHQHPGLTEKPVAPLNVSSVTKSISRWTNLAQNRLDTANDRVDDYMNDMNDNFDNFVSDTKSQAIKGLLGSKLGL
ncbi:hypothetical protein OGAPHI_007391 [Ogataea philodendri]|uniref:Lethal giant larvae (Lgl)-like C-terminal domain-containing protein n=1 Tax=Ogataea philodendri TaxID=1378263 RepID=A0A9P8T031_9ASCO|nr:uncharacterized protein OGAPHI_007391 [Ogataea philodendri]KAH3660186.1 hypothetical protein OGAPHI_007391 [Ogataea philodendri]